MKNLKQTIKQESKAANKVFTTSTGLEFKRKPNIKISADYLKEVKLAGIKWTNDSIRAMWYTILRILGNISKIQDPEVSSNLLFWFSFSWSIFHYFFYEKKKQCHEIAYSALYDMSELFVAAEEVLPLEISPPIPFMHDFMPWLLEGCVYDK